MVDHAIEIGRGGMFHAQLRIGARDWEMNRIPRSQPARSAKDRADQSGRHHYRWSMRSKDSWGFDENWRLSACDHQNSGLARSAALPFPLRSAHVLCS
jgi:hypothetical protein